MKTLWNFLCFFFIENIYWLNILILRISKTKMKNCFFLTIVTKKIIDNYDVWKRQKIYKFQMFEIENIRTKIKKIKSNEHNNTINKTKKRFVKKVKNISKTKKIFTLTRIALYAKSLIKKKKEKMIRKRNNNWKKNRDLLNNKLQIMQFLNQQSKKNSIINFWKWILSKI